MDNRAGGSVGQAWSATSTRETTMSSDYCTGAIIHALAHALQDRASCWRRVDGRRCPARSEGHPRDVAFLFAPPRTQRGACTLSLQSHMHNTHNTHTHARNTSRTMSLHCAYCFWPKIRSIMRKIKLKLRVSVLKCDERARTLHEQLRDEESRGRAETKGTLRPRVRCALHRK